MLVLIFLIGLGLLVTFLLLVSDLTVGTVFAFSRTETGLLGATLLLLLVLSKVGLDLRETVGGFLALLILIPFEVFILRLGL